MVLPTHAIRDEAHKDGRMAHQKSLWLSRLMRSACKARKTPDNSRRSKSESVCFIKDLMLAERVDITLAKKINDLGWLNPPNPLFGTQGLFDARAKSWWPNHDHLRDATRGLA